MVVLSYSPYKFGGALAWSDPSYIKRQADLNLLKAVEQGKFAYVLGPRQIGKSSLRIRTRYQLAKRGNRCAALQATQLQSDSAKDLLCILYTELISNNLQPLLQWFRSVEDSPPVDCLTRFVDVFLIELLSACSVVVFIDEIDSLLETPLGTILFSWIARCYDLRAVNSAYKQLNFVVFGTAISSNLPQVESLFSPVFSQSCEILLSPFKLFEIHNLQIGFEENLEAPTTLLSAVYRWTHGQPFLTQKLCHIIFSLLDTLPQPSFKAIQLSKKMLNQWVDDIVRSYIIQDWQTKDEPIHFKAIGDRINRSCHKKALIELYHRLLLDKPVKASNNYTQSELLLSGLVIIEDGYIKVANDIYRSVFEVKQMSLKSTIKQLKANQGRASFVKYWSL